jgi:hypothetical protein
MPLATKPDVEAFLLRPLTTGEDGYVGVLLDMASDAVMDYLPGVAWEPLNAATATVTFSHDGKAYLPRSPVRAITSVDVGGTILDPTLYSWSTWGPIYLAGTIPSANGPGILPYGTTAEVTYDGGFDPATLPVPGSIRTMVAGMVATRFQNPGGARQESIGSYSVTYLAETGTFALDAASAAFLDRFVRTGDEELTLVSESPSRAWRDWE